LQVFIDGNGDAEGNYTVVALLDDESVNTSLRMSMQTVAYFQYTPNASSNPHDLPVSLCIVITSMLYNCMFILNCVICNVTVLERKNELWILAAVIMNCILCGM
jgi:hypothetical protein